MEFRAQEIATLGKDAFQCGRPLPAFRIRDRKAHVGRLCFDTKCIEEADQVRIVECIINDEAEIDLRFVAVIVERMRACVPPGPA